MSSTCLLTSSSAGKTWLIGARNVCNTKSICCLVFQVDGDSGFQISVSLIICSSVIICCSLPYKLVLQFTCFIMKKKQKTARHVRRIKKIPKQAGTNMNLSSSLKIRVTVFGATCSQAKLAPDIPTPLFESLSKWKQSQWSKPAVRGTRGRTRRGNE